QETLGVARQHGLDVAYLEAQLGRLGNTPYTLAEVHLESEGRPFAPSSMLNAVRRDAVENLQKLQSAPRPMEIHPAASLPAASLPTPSVLPTPPSSPTLHLLVRTAGQLDAAVEFRPASITLDYLDLYGLRPSLDR